MIRFLAEIFKGPNGCWDLGRLTGAHAVTAYTAAFLYALIVEHSVPGWTDLGVGYAGVLAGAAALIGVKDIAVAKANATSAASQPQPEQQS